MNPDKYNKYACAILSQLAKNKEFFYRMGKTQKKNSKISFKVFL